MAESRDGIESHENSEFHKLFNNGTTGGNQMAKKNGRPDSQPRPKAKLNKSSYFPIQYSVQSNENVKGRFQLALATLAARGNVNLLDQTKLNNQALNNAMMLWISKKIEDGKVAWVEKELAPVMEELTVIVAKDMIERDRPFDPAYLPAGYVMSKEWAKKLKELKEGGSEE